MLRTALGLVLLAGVTAALVWASSAARLERADFVFNNGTEIATLDPAVVSGVPEGRVMYALYEGLTVKHPRTLQPLPGVAERWEVSEDGRRYLFHLRPDARWSNGDPVTATDFERSWQRLLSPQTAAEYAYQAWYLENARAYTLLPDELEYTPPAAGSWLRELHGGRVRLGVHPFAEPPSEDAPPHLLVRPGQSVAPGVPLLEVDGVPWLMIPISGRVEAVAQNLPATASELLDAPYDAPWIAEVSPAPGALEEARTEGRLRDADHARRELFWPRVGVRALDPRTLEVRLRAPTPYFLDLTSFYPLFPVHLPTIERMKERFPDTWQVEWVRPENIVTNGPYQVVERRINDRIRLRKNPYYWDADRVAFRTIDVLAVESYSTMLNLYLTGEVDWIERCAPNLIPRMLPREDFNPVPYLGTYFYRVNVKRPPFDDVRVRRALALSIDRRAIVEKITKKGELPNWSLCPPGLAGYDRPEMEHTPVAPDLSNYDEAFAADCARAVQLLDEAGYGPGKRSLPTIEIHYNTSESHRDIAEVIADTWNRVLGVEAKLLNQEWKVYLDTQTTMNYDVSRSAWIQDYPDPNTFVDLFVTDGENNRTGWSNPRYDELVEGAAVEPDPTRRLAMLREAEALLLEELPILPIYSYATQNVVNPRLGGFFENASDDHYPKFWYWMDDAELAAKRAAQPADWILVPAPGPSQGLYPPAGRDAVLR